jgi:formate dehydrogenase major subunit
MGSGEHFAFQSAEEIWNEIRQVWKAGYGITYERLRQGGLQWPCPSEDHPGTEVLHTDGFASGDQAPLRCIDYKATPETVSNEYPFLLTTGRSLYQFNAGTMTMRTSNVALRPADVLSMSPADAARLGVGDGEKVRVRSRHGEAVLCVGIDSSVREGELFATFHTAGVFLNYLTSAHRDWSVKTPEYKVVAVRVEKR